MWKLERNLYGPVNLPIFTEAREADGGVGAAEVESGESGTTDKYSTPFVGGWSGLIMICYREVSCDQHAPL